MSTRRQFLQSVLFLPSLFAANAFAQENMPPAPQTSPAFADFEGGTWGDWTTQGDAFGATPATDALFPGKIHGFSGRGFVCTLHPKKGNAATGKAVSREFTIKKPFITFKIGGGHFPGQACLNLVVDGQIIRTATGGGVPDLSDVSWDVTDLVSKKAHFEIVDSTTAENRGYILVDDIAFTDISPDEQIDPRLQSQLSALLRETRQKYELPAIFAAVGYRGKIRALDCLGIRKLGYEPTVTINDKVMVGSITKTFTAIVAGNLAAQGIITASTTIGNVLTELRDSMNPAYRDATVWQLLRHVAGIVHDVAKLPDESIKSSSKYRYAIVCSLLQTPPAVPIGQFFYGGGCEVVAVMCERLTGKTYEELLNQYIFKPCGMRTAGIPGRRPYDDGSKTGTLNQPWGHIRKDGTIVPYQLDWNYRIVVSAGGGIICTIADLCRYGNAMAPGIIKRGADTPLGKVGFRTVCEELTWGGGHGTDGNTGLGDYSSLSISPAGLVVVLHSTLAGDDGGKDASYEVISKIQSQFNLS